MKRTYKRLGADRTFLNQPGLVSLNSNISYRITLEGGNDLIKEEGLFDYADIQFGISDCNKTIFLDFRIEDKENYDNCCYKLDRIIETCQTMKKDLEKAYTELQIGLNRVKELEENDKKD